MAEEWVKEGAAQEKIDATAKHTKSPAQSQSPQHSGSIHCTECGAEIPRLAEKRSLARGFALFARRHRITTFSASIPGREAKTDSCADGCSS
jgi:hypothetical protein